LGFWFEVRALEIREEDSASGAERKRSGSRASDSEAAAGDSSLREFFRLRERRGRCGSFLVAGIFRREERLLRDFPPCEHYLLRAFQGWTLADSEAAAGDSSLRGFFRLRERRGRCGSFLVAGTLRREERLLRDFPPCEHYLLRAFKGSATGRPDQRRSATRISDDT
jgi:hypothetical protein